MDVSCILGRYPFIPVISLLFYIYNIRFSSIIFITTALRMRLCLNTVQRLWSQSLVQGFCKVSRFSFVFWYFPYFRIIELSLLLLHGLKNYNVLFLISLFYPIQTYPINKNLRYVLFVFICVLICFSVFILQLNFCHCLYQGMKLIVCFPITRYSIFFKGLINSVIFIFGKSRLVL